MSDFTLRLNDLFYTSFLFSGGCLPLRGKGKARSHLNSIFFNLFRRAYQRSSDLWVSAFVKSRQSHGEGGGVQEDSLVPPLYLLHVTREFYSIKLICRNLYAIFFTCEKSLYSQSEWCTAVFHM